jgi:diguanylate cyclase (GGDEF)-like protein
LATEAPHCSLEDVIGKTDFDFYSEPHAAAAFEDEQWILKTGQSIIGKVERVTFHDRPDTWLSTSKYALCGDDGQVLGTFGISRDITAQVEAERALSYLALHDSLTGLASRSALSDRISQALLALGRRPGRVGICFVDLDNFKEINDRLGHEVGDRALRSVSRRLTGIARQVDTVARFGGDEFVLLFDNLVGDQDLCLIGDRILAALREPVRGQGWEIVVSGTIGIAATSDPGVDVNELLRQADIAMYRAKRAGRGCYQVFENLQ